MVDTKRYNPTIKRFQKHTKDFISSKPKKGHLIDEEEKGGETKKEEGVLVKVKINDMNSNGWEVKVSETSYWCTYGDNIQYLPDCFRNGSYYIPKHECKVEVSLDTKSKVYTITKMNDPTKKPISMNNKGIIIQGSEDASLRVEENQTTITGEKLSVQGDVEVDTSDNDEIEHDSISMLDLYKELQIIKGKLDNTE